MTRNGIFLSYRLQTRDEAGRAGEPVDFDFLKSINLNTPSCRRFESLLIQNRGPFGLFDSKHTTFQDYDDDQMLDRVVKPDSQFPFSL